MEVSNAAPVSVRHDLPCPASYAGRIDEPPPTALLFAAQVGLVCLSMARAMPHRVLYGAILPPNLYHTVASSLLVASLFLVVRPGAPGSDALCS